MNHVGNDADQAIVGGLNGYMLRQVVGAERKLDDDLGGGDWRMDMVLGTYNHNLTLGIISGPSFKFFRGETIKEKYSGKCDC